MIARIWHRRVPISKSNEYLRLMRTVAIADYKSVPGNRGSFALHRIEGEIAHCSVLTFWESREAIAQFVEENIDLAKHYDFDRDFLLALEPFLQHFQLYGE